MSYASNNALQILNSGDVQRGLELAIDAVDQTPNDWHCHYAVGIGLRHLKRYPEACNAYENALKFDHNQPPVLLALAIARQLNEQFDESVVAAKRAIEIDPDYYLAYNTLGMTRKLQGEFEYASLNYETGAKTLTRGIVKTLVNSFDSPLFSVGETRFNLWLQYALESAVFNASSAGLNRILTPSAELAVRDSYTSEYGGYFWSDVTDVDGKLGRLFLPNFFSTMFYRLKNEPAFRTFLGNRYTVLKALGQDEEAEKHLYEAEELSEV
jgi:tetratricopeptide (TPR) repeat protein